MNYKESFKLAIDRTKRLNLNINTIIFNDNKYISQEFINTFPYALRDEFGEFRVEELDRQCLSINFRIKDFISDFLKCPVYYTIGYVVLNDEELFYQDEKSLLDILEKGVNSNTIYIHAWLTLPSMEIIDSSIITTYALIHNKKEELGGVIFNHPDYLKEKNNIKFVPMLIGEDFLWKTGIIKGFHF